MEPTFFELLAADHFPTFIQPLFELFVSRIFPQGTFLYKYRTEIWISLRTIVDNYHLKHYSSTFALKHFNLQFISRSNPRQTALTRFQRYMILFLTTFIPYISGKIRTYSLSLSHVFDDDNIDSLDDVNLPSFLTTTPQPLVTFTECWDILFPSSQHHQHPHHTLISIPNNGIHHDLVENKNQKNMQKQHSDQTTITTTTTTTTMTIPHPELVFNSHTNDDRYISAPFPTLTNTKNNNNNNYEEGDGNYTNNDVNNINNNIIRNNNDNNNNNNNNIDDTNNNDNHHCLNKNSILTTTVPTPPIPTQLTHPLLHPTILPDHLRAQFPVGMTNNHDTTLLTHLKGVVSSSFLLLKTILLKLFQGGPCEPYISNSLSTLLTTVRSLITHMKKLNLTTKAFLAINYPTIKHLCGQYALFLYPWVHSLILAIIFFNKIAFLLNYTTYWNFILSLFTKNLHYTRFVPTNNNNNNNNNITDTTLFYRNQTGSINPDNNEFNPFNTNNSTNNDYNNLFKFNFFPKISSPSPHHNYSFPTYILTGVFATLSKLIFGLMGCVGNTIDFFARNEKTIVIINLITRQFIDTLAIQSDLQQQGVLEQITQSNTNRGNNNNDDNSRNNITINGYDVNSIDMVQLESESIAALAGFLFGSSSNSSSNGQGTPLFNRINNTQSSPNSSGKFSKHGVFTPPVCVVRVGISNSTSDECDDNIVSNDGDQCSSKEDSKSASPHNHNSNSSHNTIETNDHDDSIILSTDITTPHSTHQIVHPLNNNHEDSGGVCSDDDDKENNENNKSSSTKLKHNSIKSKKMAIIHKKTYSKSAMKCTTQQIFQDNDNLKWFSPKDTQLPAIIQKQNPHQRAIIPSDLSVCQWCFASPITAIGATNTGYCCCYQCLLEYVEYYQKCPFTHTPMRVDDIRSIWVGK